MDINTKIKGFILIYVLWFLTIIGFIVALVLSYVKVDTQKSLNISEKYIIFVQALAYARIALNQYIDESTNINFPLHEREYKFLSGSNLVYKVYITPEDGRLSLNLTDSLTLEKLFRYCGIKDYKKKAQSIIIDREINNLEYRSLMQLLDYMSYNDFIKIKEFLTVSFMPVNPNFADIKVLLSIGMSDSEVKNIMSIRKQRFILEKDVLLSGDISKKLAFYPRSFLFRVKVVEEKSRYKIELILDRRGAIIDIYE